MVDKAHLDALLETLRGMDEGRIAFWVVRDEHHGMEWGYDWDNVYAGNVIYETETGWRVEIFNDCDSFDYVDSARAPDGTEMEFDDWAFDYDAEEPRHAGLCYFSPTSDLWITAQPKYAPRKRSRPPKPSIGRQVMDFAAMLLDLRR